MNLLDVTSKELASSFDNNGYELIMENRQRSSLSVEESIIAALIKQNPRLIEGIPILLIKNKINYTKLRKLIYNYKLWNEFGYLGEFTLRHVKSKELSQLVSDCRDNLKPEACLDNFFRESSLIFQKPEEKTWRLTGAPPYSALEKQLKRYIK